MALPFVTERKAEQITKEVIKEGGITGGSSNVLILRNNEDVEPLEIEDPNYENFIIKKDFNIDDITELVMFSLDYAGTEESTELIGYNVGHHPLIIVHFDSKDGDDGLDYEFDKDIHIFKLNGEWHLKIQISE